MLWMMPTAMATAFQGPTTGSTSVFDYAWFDTAGSPVASGSTTYTFTSTTLTTGAHCAGLSGCMMGTFITGNGGEGMFTTSLATGDCTFSFPTLSCNIEQSLSFSYAGTGALYSGRAVLGSQAFLFGFIDLGYTASPGVFDGTMVLSTDYVGDFTE